MMDASENYWKVMTQAAIFRPEDDLRIAEIVFYGEAYNIEGDVVRITEYSTDLHAVTVEAGKIAKEQGVPLHDYAPGQVQELVAAIQARGSA